MLLIIKIITFNFSRYKSSLARHIKKYILIFNIIPLANSAYILYLLYADSLNHSEKYEITIIIIIIILATFHLIYILKIEMWF